MLTRRQHKPPKGGYKSGLMILLDRAAVGLVAKGSVRAPSGTWLSEADILLCTRKSCGWNRNDTPTSMLEDQFRLMGWAWRWEGDDLVLVLPGWTQPDPVIIAIQRGLFD